MVLEELCYLRLRLRTHLTQSAEYQLSFSRQSQSILWLMANTKLLIKTIIIKLDFLIFSWSVQLIEITTIPFFTVNNHPRRKLHWHQSDNSNYQASVFIYWSFFVVWSWSYPQYLGLKSCEVAKIGCWAGRAGQMNRGCTLVNRNLHSGTTELNCSNGNTRIKLSFVTHWPRMKCDSFLTDKSPRACQHYYFQWAQVCLSILLLRHSLFQSLR